MKLRYETYSSLCSMAVFEINGIQADTSDFGYGENTESYQDDMGGIGCGNKVFRLTRCTQPILDKYRISIDEFNQIGDILEKELSFGCCNLCN